MIRPEGNRGRRGAESMTALVESHGGVLFDLGAAGGPRPARPGDLAGARVPVGIRIQSTRVKPGELFAGLRGLRTDGARFLPDAFSRGATSALVSPERSVGDAAAAL
ncbi:MAG: Mur ligase domain-containing protein, partial [Planctomycetota bacterium]|nr:Mur ligase domain-containing protein [Planctomycetota bacterium]